MCEQTGSLSEAQSRYKEVQAAAHTAMLEVKELEGRALELDKLERKRREQEDFKPTGGAKEVADQEADRGRLQMEDAQMTLIKSDDDIPGILSRPLFRRRLRLISRTSTFQISLLMMPPTSQPP